VQPDNNEMPKTISKNNNTVLVLLLKIFIVFATAGTVYHALQPISEEIIPSTSNVDNNKAPLPIVAAHISLLNKNTTELSGYYALV
jgi:hypothetical protein